MKEKKIPHNFLAWRKKKQTNPFKVTILQRKLKSVATIAASWTEYLSPPKHRHRHTVRSIHKLKSDWQLVRRHADKISF